MRHLLAPALLLAAGCGHPHHCDLQGDCPTNQICNVDRCQPAVERFWTFDIVQADVGQVHPDGYDWDDDGTPPDLWVEFGIDYGDVWQTSTEWDTYHPIWDQRGDVYVPSEGQFLINLYDEDPDVANSEWVTGFYWDDPAAMTSLLRSCIDRDLEVVDESGTVSLELYCFPYD